MKKLLLIMLFLSSFKLLADHQVVCASAAKKSQELAVEEASEKLNRKVMSLAMSVREVSEPTMTTQFITNNERLQTATLASLCVTVEAQAFRESNL